MITKIGQVMLYVSDQDKAKQFWTEKMGFVVISEEGNEQMRWIEIAPTKSAETSFVLHNKDLIAQMQPDMNVGTPSLLFFTEDLDKLYEELSGKQVTVGEKVTMPTGRVFNFADEEDNYFAVLERK